jgi:hypothetical protein
VKGKSLRGEPRVCLCVEDETPPYSFVITDRITEITEDPGLLLEWATRSPAATWVRSGPSSTVAATPCPVSCWCESRRTTSWPKQTSPTKGEVDKSVLWTAETSPSTRRGDCGNLAQNSTSPTSIR